MKEDVLKIIEEWKPVKNYEGLYEISNYGRVKSINRQGTSGKIIKSDLRRDGYLQVHLVKKGKMKNYLVHRLVAEIFIPNYDNLPEVNHINEIKVDCRAENLEWCDRKYNMNYGNRPYKNALKVQQLDKEDNVIAIFNSIREAGRINNINQSHITKCCKGQLKTIGGYVWRYANEE